MRNLSFGILEKSNQARKNRTLHVSWNMFKEIAKVCPEVPEDIYWLEVVDAPVEMRMLDRDVNYHGHMLNN